MDNNELIFLQFSKQRLKGTIKLKQENLIKNQIYNIHNK